MKKILSFVIALIPALVFAGELKITVMDKELEFPLEGVKVSLQAGKSGKQSTKSSAGTSGAEAFQKAGGTTLSKGAEFQAETDENGEAVFILPENITTGTIEATLPGYKKATENFTGLVNPVLINMSISDVIEGKELVVNRASPEKKEEKTGVSTVITEKQMHTTANMSLVEDCMASVRTLPGVSYSGVWGSEPSVRGGEPRELGYLLDGMYTIFPWHWGGGVSIFNPSFVDSIKLSNGVFPAQYGRASSGLLEATTIKPDYEKFHLNLNSSTTCFDAFAQIPFGKNVGGMLAGFHASFLEPAIALYKATGDESLDMLTKAPYIRDAFLKANFTPMPELDISLTGFFGSDGLGIDSTTEEDGLKSKQIMDYDIYQGLAGLNVKYLPNDKLMLHTLISYNLMKEDMLMKMTESGKMKYTEDFKKYASQNAITLEGDTYTLPDLDTKVNEIIVSHLITARAETEIELSEKNHLCAGIEEVWSTADTKEDQKFWTDLDTGSERQFMHLSWYSDKKGNCILDNAAFINWDYGNTNSLIQSQIGLRGEFINLWNKEEDYSINFIPDLCPRATVTYTPFRNIGLLEKSSFTAGTGLFVSIPRETMLFGKEMNIKDYEMNTNRSLFGVIGADASLENGWSFKLETYYKYYLSRIYSYQVSHEEAGYQDGSMHVKSDGKGHVFGIDAMIEKKPSEKWDGYLSYSFVYTRFLNPLEAKKGEHIEEMYGNPLNEWFYPDYHRFHTLNLVSNWHFGKQNNWTFTVKGTLATGAPEKEVGPVTCYAANLDGTVIQRYSRSSFYSDTLRTDISCPVDLRLAYEWKSHNNKTEWEFYVAAQDIFVNLYAPKGNKNFNAHTGKMDDNGSNVDFNIGLPVPSIGLKMKF